MRIRSARVAVTLCACAALSQGVARPSRAQPAPAEQTDEQRAVVLFEQARLFVKSNHCDDAIPIFEASLKLHETVGSQLNIADCYEKMHRSFSAWTSFRKAEHMAHDEHDDREKLAHERAAALEFRIPKLVVDVPPECNVPGFELHLDRDLLGTADWGKAQPMDPGTHVLEATAPGKKRWAGAVLLDPATDVQHVAVPVLEDDMKIVREAPVAPRGQRQRIVGASLMLTGIGIAAALGTIATLTRSDHSKPPVLGIVFFAAGGATALAGGIIFLTAPRADATAWQLGPLVGDRTAGLSLGRAW